MRTACQHNCYYQVATSQESACPHISDVTADKARFAALICQAQHSHLKCRPINRCPGSLLMTPVICIVGSKNTPVYKIQFFASHVRFFVHKFPHLYVRDLALILKFLSKLF